MSCAQTPSGVKGVAEFDGVHAGGFAIENHDVAADAGGIDLQAGNLGDAVGKMLGVFVVFVEARGRFLERQ